MCIAKCGAKEKLPREMPPRFARKILSAPSAESEADDGTLADILLMTRPRSGAYGGNGSTLFILVFCAIFCDEFRFWCFASRLH